MINHNCPSSSAGPSGNLPLDETELCEERRLMENVRAGTGSFILEEARTCYEFSRWADVTLISSSDCVAIKVHSLVLGAACPMLQSAMAELGQIDQDEMAVILPDTNKEDLLVFGNYLYNNNHNSHQENYSSLLELINFDSKIAATPANPSEHSSNACDSKADDDYYLDDEDVDEECDTSSPFPQYNVKEIRDLVSNQPRRIKYEEAAGTGKHTKVWKTYKQILLDRKKIPFLECKVCGDIFLQSSTSSSTGIKKHAKSHSHSQPTPDDKQDQQLILNLGLEDVQQMIQSEPQRITQHQNSTSSSEIWKHFSVISVDGVQVPYVRCDTCALLLPHSNGGGTNALKKHQFKHADKKGEREGCCGFIIFILSRCQVISRQEESPRDG